MIVEALLGVVSWFLDILLFPLDIEGLPETFYTVLGTLVAKLIRAATIIGTYIHPTYILALLTFVLAFNSAIGVYYVLLWILKKFLS